MPRMSPERRAEVVWCLRALAAEAEDSAKEPFQATHHYEAWRAQAADLREAADELESLGQEPAATTKALEGPMPSCVRCGRAMSGLHAVWCHARDDEPKGERP